MELHQAIGIVNIVRICIRNWKLLKMNDLSLFVSNKDVRNDTLTNMLGLRSQWNQMNSNWDYTRTEIQLWKMVPKNNKFNEAIN